MFTYHVDDEVALQLLLPAHAEPLIALVEANRPFLTRWVDVERLNTADDARAYIRWALHALANGDGMRCGILYRGELVGRLSYHDTEWHHQVTELGYWLAEALNGQGIVTRAARGLLDYAFHTLKMHRAEIWTSEKNIPSQRVAERLGFRKEAVMRQMTALHDSEYGDFLVYGLLGEEWPATRQTGGDSGEFTLKVDEATEIRLLLPHHAEILCQGVLANRPRLDPWLNWPRNIQTPNDARAFITNALHGLAEEGTMRCGIWHASEFAGVIGIVALNPRTQQEELGYWLDERFTGRGIMTRAVAAMTAACFTQLGIKSVTIRCAVHNRASCAIAERLGFRMDGVLRQGHGVAGQLQDMAVYSMLAKEWK